MKPFAAAFDLSIAHQDMEILRANFRANAMDKMSHSAYREFLGGMAAIILDGIKDNRNDPAKLSIDVLMTIHTIFECGVLCGCEMNRPDLIF